jgi:recombination protein RecA
MASAAALRLQIESALSVRIPSALTPTPRVMRPTAPTGIAALDERLGGGLPMGGISELTGPECSGRTSLALSFVAGLTEAGRVCVWVDVSDALDPESAAVAGVDLDRLLWVRCGEEAQQMVLPGLGGDASSSGEAGCDSDSEKKQVPRLRWSQKAAPDSARDGNTFFADRSFAPRCAEPQPTVRRKNREVISAPPPMRPSAAREASAVRGVPAAKRPLAVREYSRLDQALRATDLLLQAGGFSAIVLDMGSVAPEFALRVPLATWFRYRAAAERTQACVLLLTQHACTKSSAGVVLTLRPDGCTTEGGTVLTGSAYRVEVARERFARVAEFSRKPPQSDYGSAQGDAHSIQREPYLSSGCPGSVRWQSHTAWAGGGEGSAAESRGRR